MLYIHTVYILSHISNNKDMTVVTYMWGQCFSVSMKWDTEKHSKKESAVVRSHPTKSKKNK